MELFLESLAEEGLNRRYYFQSPIKAKTRLVNIASVYMGGGEVDRFVAFRDKKECVVMYNAPSGYMLITPEEKSEHEIVKELRDALLRAIELAESE